jgi:NAD(P)-dependent dehydrogenase (short-subunit alcohol dehydrogenase family)
VLEKTLEGQRAIVFGGGSGIGLGSARMLARDGAHVTISGRTEQKLIDAAAALADEGLEVSYFAADANDGAQVSAAVDHASQDGKLHMAVVVPGQTTFRPVLLWDDDGFIDEVSHNIQPVFLLLKYAGRAMVRAGFGSFVAVSSTAGAFSSRYISAYCTGKAGIDHLVHVAADELGEANIRVNSVRPGMTRTPASANSFSNTPLMDAFRAQGALPRLGEIDDQAALIRFLAGPESSWITGQNIAVDGGNTLRAFPDWRPLMPPGRQIPDQVAEIRAGIH